MQPNPEILTPSRWFRSRDEVISAGFAPGWRQASGRIGVNVTAYIGGRAVVFGLGQWREGVIVKVTDSYVFAQYHVASSDRLWVGKGSRTEQRTDLYIRP